MADQTITSIVNTPSNQVFNKVNDDSGDLLVKYGNTTTTDKHFYGYNGTTWVQLDN